MRRSPVFHFTKVTYRSPRREAWHHFLEARAKLGRPTACEENPTNWDAPIGMATVDDARRARESAAKCKECPLLYECSRVAAADREIGGVIAGQIRFAPRGRPKATAKPAGPQEKEQDND